MPKVSKPVVGVIGNSTVINDRHNVQVVGQRNMRAVAEVAGALPLMFAYGAGSASRRTIGVVIVFGVMVSTLLSLFVVPAIYRALARYTRSPEAVAHELAAQGAQHPDADAEEQT